MSETALTPTTETTPEPEHTPGAMLLDGDAPRLGSTPITPPSAVGSVGTPAPIDAGGAPTLPVTSPVLVAPESTMQADDRFRPSSTPVDAASLPTLPDVSPARPAVIEDHPVTDTEPLDDGDEHPMAHLMPSKSKPTEASRKAAEQRAAQKAKAKKTKVVLAVGALVVSALAGPPFVSWLSNAINEAGNTSTEAPAE